MKELTAIEIIWDRDHGMACEGWYVRSYYGPDQPDEDENLGPAGCLPQYTPDNELIAKFIPLDEQESGVPIEVIR